MQCQFLTYKNKYEQNVTESQGLLVPKYWTSIIFCEYAEKMSTNTIRKYSDLKNIRNEVIITLHFPIELLKILIQPSCQRYRNQW